MSDTAKIISSPGAAGPVFRRHHQKADGRSLYLYGHKPHNLPPFPESSGKIAPGGELRWHPLRGEYAVYAGHRQNRTHLPNPADNPLAPMRKGGGETEIPFTDFELAVFDNRFPSLHRDAADPPTADETHQRLAAKGKCEVIVYSADSETRLSNLTMEQRILLVEAWIDRYTAMREMGLAYILPFENRGTEIGATLHHPHGQIYGFPIVPKPQEQAAKVFANGFDLVSAMDSWGEAQQVAANGTMIAMVPPFARFPYECWIIPKTALPGPWTFSAQQVSDFADLLGRMQAAYDALFTRPMPYMMSLHAAPTEHDAPYHFTAQFYPMLRDAKRVKYLASVEQATGIFTVDIAPEEAAEHLRAVFA
ncbi:galactose-1-phosphate uridylyltransferase [Alterisphingorhabdus coralli]|uniref:Galactose-1-phosphate uridylyltransferase n=1 Tax=Alterisphingorhabdus coralli TaxID=3071408 RepID=A0AA97I080_9SPHN|nr:galactose-1-phosphate uridylyltransferase [Parasphingorhabdus sp. SCSIO 66989]WOE73890.1 galactose-1-phosphate uridylyltransferase [Parasphingorhabdus sp. SCSIO 66989]